MVTVQHKSSMTAFECACFMLGRKHEVDIAVNAAYIKNKIQKI